MPQYFLERHNRTAEQYPLFRKGMTKAMHAGFLQAPCFGIVPKGGIISAACQFCTVNVAEQVTVSFAASVLGIFLQSGNNVIIQRDDKRLSVFCDTYIDHFIFIINISALDVDKAVNRFPVKRAEKNIKFSRLTVSNTVSRFLCGETKVVLFHRRQDAQIALNTSCVVITNILLDHLDKPTFAGEPSAVIAFPLQNAPEALHRTVINAMRHTRHTLCHSGLHELVAEGAVGIHWLISPP